MTIKQAIENIASDLGLNFNYGTSYDFNIQADNSLFPCCVLLEPDDLGFIVDGSIAAVYRKSTTFIQFLDILPKGVGIAEQAVDRLPIIEAMSDLATEFINSIVNSSELSLNSLASRLQINAIVLRDKYDAHACGIELQLPLFLTQQEDIC